MNLKKYLKYILTVYILTIKFLFHKKYYNAKKYTRMLKLANNSFENPKLGMK